MARSIAADHATAYRAVLTARNLRGEEISWHEGIYNKKAQATGRVTFWRNHYKRIGRSDAFLGGRVDRATINWEPVE